jgi:hypothetical protein
MKNFLKDFIIGFLKGLIVLIILVLIWWTFEYIGYEQGIKETQAKYQSRIDSAIHQSKTTDSLFYAEYIKYRTINDADQFINHSEIK